MNGVFAELVLQFSQQGSLPLLEMVAHGWLKHLDFMILDVVCLWISFTLAFGGMGR